MPGDAERDVGRPASPRPPERVARRSTPTSTPVQLADAVAQTPRGGVRVDREQDERCPGPFAFEASTPAEAQTNPWRVSAMTSGGRGRGRPLGSRGGSPRSAADRRRAASSRARSDGSTSVEMRRRDPRPSRPPSARRRRRRPSSKPARALRAAATRSAPRSSPSSSSGIPRSGMTRSSPAHGEPVTRIPACPL